MILNDSSLKAFCPSKVLTEDKDRINSLTISDCGEYLITASDGDQIQMYSCLTAKHLNTCQSQKYGCDNIKFTHSNTCVLHTSNKQNDDIRYMSLHDYKYLRYFSGHTARVRGLCISPENDSFVSVSEDKTARIWDLRITNCQGLIYPHSLPNLVSIDPKGLIFAVSTFQKTLLLYDLRSFDKGPFHEFSVPISSFHGKPGPKAVETCVVSDFKFSADGKRIATLVLNENESVISILDSFEGRVLESVAAAMPWGYLAKNKNPLLNSFQVRVNLAVTPNSQYFLYFAARQFLDLYMHAWRFENGQGIALYDPFVNGKICNLSGHTDVGFHSSLSLFNHKYMMMVSTCDRSLIFWQPDSDKS